MALRPKARRESVPLDEWEFVEEEDTLSADDDRHGGGDDEGQDLGKYLLWRVVKQQVAILQKELNDELESAETTETLLSVLLKLALRCRNSDVATDQVEAPRVTNFLRCTVYSSR